VHTVQNNVIGRAKFDNEMLQDNQSSFRSLVIYETPFDIILQMVMKHRPRRFNLNLV